MSVNVYFECEWPNIIEKQLKFFFHFFSSFSFIYSFKFFLLIIDQWIDWNEILWKKQKLLNYHHKNTPNKTMGHHHHHQWWNRIIDNNRKITEEARKRLNMGKSIKTKKKTMDEYRKILFPFFMKIDAWSSTYHIIIRNQNYHWWCRGIIKMFLGLVKKLMWSKWWWWWCGRITFFCKASEILWADVSSSWWSS